MAELADPGPGAAMLELYMGGLRRFVRKERVRFPIKFWLNISFHVWNARSTDARTAVWIVPPRQLVTQARAQGFGRLGPGSAA
jgi:hypothetical protein